MQKLFAAFLFDHGGAKRKAEQKRNAANGFRPLRRATKAPRLGWAPPFKKDGRKL